MSEFYTGTGDASDVRTCAAIWTALQPQLTTPAALQQLSDVTCSRPGFDPTSAAQALRCNEELESLGTLFGVPAATSLQFIRSAQLANGITQALRSSDISVASGALMDRQVMSESFGASEAMDRWIPKLRGFMLATALGVFPVALLFIMTPFMTRALMLCIGLFTWLALWGVADAISVAMAADAAADAFSQMKNMGYSYDALMMSPEAAVQAIGVFGKARAMALGLATVLSYAIFQFGGYAFTSMASQWQQDLQQAGEASGRTAVMPEQRAAVMSGSAGSLGTMAAIELHGFGNTSLGASQSAMTAAGVGREVGRAQGYISPALSGAASDRSDGASVFEQQGAIQGANTLATVRSLTDLARQRGEDLGHYVSDNQSFETQLSASSTSRFRDDAAGRDTRADQIGALTGSQRAAEVAVQGELRGKFDAANPSSPQSALDLARLSSGSQIALAEEVDGDPDTYIQAQRLRQGTDLVAAAQTYDSLGPTADERLGRVQARETTARTQAVESLPQSSYAAGVRLAVREQAERGAAAQEAGGLDEFARAAARQSVGETAGRIDATQRIADAIGIDGTTPTGIAELTSLRDRANVAIVATDDPGQRAAIAEDLGIGENNPNVRDAFVNSGTGVVSFALGDDGQAGAIRYSAGSSASIDDSASTNRETRTSVGTNVYGGVAVVTEPGVLEDQLASAWRPDQDWPESAAQYNAIARSIGENWSSQGLNITQDRSEQLVWSVSAGLGLKLGGNGAGADSRISDAQSVTTRNDVNVQLAERLLDVTREAAEQQLHERYGNGAWESDATLQQEFAETWAQNLRGATSFVLTEGTRDTALASGMNDTAKDAIQRSRTAQDSE
jgi:hypothetical protein